MIRAPFDGYVAERLVSPGQFVQPQAPVMRIVRLQPLKLTAEVPEKFAPWIETGREMAVKVDAFPQQVFAGRVVRIAPGVNLRSRAFAIEGEVPNPDGKLKPGTFARVQITTDHVERAVTIPVAAVQSRYGTNRVFVVKDGQLAGREVVLGDRLGDRVEVSAGARRGHADRLCRRGAARGRHEGDVEVGAKGAKGAKGANGAGAKGANEVRPWRAPHL